MCFAREEQEELQCMCESDEATEVVIQVPFLMADRIVRELVHEIALFA
jgi:hypothetical protein